MSEKTFDGKGRWRCVTVGFRMSPEENETLNTKVYLSGLHNCVCAEKRNYCARKSENLQGIEKYALWFSKRTERKRQLHR